jgi:hypothetical protein
MQRKLFVSYARIAEHGTAFGFSYAVLTMTGPMTADAIKQMHDYLNAQSPGYNVTVLSFQELETAEESASV